MLNLLKLVVAEGGVTVIQFDCEKSNLSSPSYKAHPLSQVIFSLVTKISSCAE